MLTNRIDPNPGAKVLTKSTNEDEVSIEKIVNTNDATAIITERNEIIIAVLLLIFR